MLKGSYWDKQCSWFAVIMRFKQFALNDNLAYITWAILTTLYRTDP